MVCLDVNIGFSYSSMLDMSVAAGVAAEGRTGEGGSYSSFADAMSPKDRARYIAYNETKFYEEFSERASAAGLNDIQIRETYEAMRSGDFTKMATYFDTSSPENCAIFWSGN